MIDWVVRVWVLFSCQTIRFLWMLLDASFYRIVLICVLRRRLISNDVSSTLRIPSRQSIKSLSKSIAWNHSSLRFFWLIEVIEHQVQICVCHLLQMISNILVSVNFYFEILLLVSWALSGKFVWGCQSGSMFVFWLLKDLLLLRATLGSEI